MKRAGMMLILSGVLAVLFFVVTDPRVAPNWIENLVWQRNVVDASHDAIAGTILGLAGGALVVTIGVWLTVRRSV